MLERLFFNKNNHYYTFAATGLKMKSLEFLSRREAEHEMHLVMKKHGLHIEDTYDDHHYKTYLCNNGIRFYINRI